MPNNILIERRGNVLEITLNRPKANAIDRVTSIELGEAFVQLRDDPDLRVGIISGGEGAIFCAGWDLKAAASGTITESDDYGPGGFAGLTELFDLDKPVVAAVNGTAVGGGFEIALACDIVVAVESAKFFLPEARLGLLADAGGLQRLPKRLPYNVAMDILLTGRRLSAQDAFAYGFVNRVVPIGNSLLQAREIAVGLANSAPLSLKAIKQIARGTAGMSVEESFRAVKSGMFAAYQEAISSLDAQEGPRAFAEGREPVFQGR